MAKVSCVLFAWASILLLYHARPNMAWFLDQPTTPSNEGYPASPNVDYDNARPSWQPSNPNLSPSYDPFSRPSIDHPPSNPNLSPGYDPFSRPSIVDHVPSNPIPSYDPYSRPSIVDHVPSNPIPSYDPYSRPSIVDHHSPSHSIDHGLDSSSNPIHSPSYPSYPSFPSHREIDSPSHYPPHGHDRPTVSDNFGVPRNPYFEARPAPGPIFPPSTHDSGRLDSHGNINRNYYNEPRSPDLHTPPFGGHEPRFPSSIPSSDSSSQLQDCKCICSNEAMKAEHFATLQNWIKGAQSSSQDVVCMSTGIPSDGSASHGIQGPQTLPSGHSGYYWIRNSGEGPTETPVPKPVDVIQEIEGRKDEITTATPTTCANIEPPVDTGVVVEPDVVPNPEPDPPVVEPEVVPPEPDDESTIDNQPQAQNRAPEFKSGTEMSESAVAGLVCGIFAVVVLIVVVVVSRKVIVASAQKSKRKSEEEQIDAYDDPNGFSKTSSSAGYPPRYL